MAKPGRPKGTKPARSHTIAVRLEPITMLAVELAAASDRCSASAFMDAACREITQRRHVALDQNADPVSALELAQRIWAPDPELQAVRLAIWAPHLIPTAHRALGEAIVYLCDELHGLDLESRRRALVDPKAIEAQAQEAWVNNPELHKEFFDWEGYLAYEKAMAQGLVKLYSKMPEPYLAWLLRVAEAALPEIKAAIQGDAIDYKRITEIAQAAFAQREAALAKTG